MTEMDEMQNAPDLVLHCRFWVNFMETYSTRKQIDLFYS